jgi:hypothetical protein
MIPGGIPAVIAGLVIGGTLGEIVAFAILSAWELIAALICFALSMSVLHNCDMPVMKMRN